MYSLNSDTIHPFLLKEYYHNSAAYLAFIFKNETILEMYIFFHASIKFNCKKQVALNHRLVCN